MRTLILASIFLPLFSIAPVVAEEPQGADLTATLHRLDQALFDAFNQCADPAQLARHATYFAPDLEFYHDNGGVTWTRDAMLANTRQHACGNYTRVLVEDSFKVSPVKDFGAITTGVHRFCQVKTGECGGEADFAMVWRNTAGHWEVTRALSYGHRPVAAQAADGSGH